MRFIVCQLCQIIEGNMEKHCLLLMFGHRKIIQLDSLRNKKLLLTFIYSFLTDMAGYIIKIAEFCNGLNLWLSKKRIFQQLLKKVNIKWVWVCSRQTSRFSIILFITPNLEHVICDWSIPIIFSKNLCVTIFSFRNILFQQS